jgi:hypothetical protein
VLWGVCVEKRRSNVTHMQGTRRREGETGNRRNTVLINGARLSETVSPPKPKDIRCLNDRERKDTGLSDRLSD